MEMNQNWLTEKKKGEMGSGIFKYKIKFHFSLI